MTDKTTDECQNRPSDMLTIAILRSVLAELPDGADDWPIAILLPGGAVVTPATIGDFDCKIHGTALAFDCRSYKKRREPR